MGREGLVFVELEGAEDGVRPGFFVGGLARSLQQPPGGAGAGPGLGIDDRYTAESYLYFVFGLCMLYAASRPLRLERSKA